MLGGVFATIVAIICAVIGVAAIALTSWNPKDDSLRSSLLSVVVSFLTYRIVTVAAGAFTAAVLSGFLAYTFFTGQW
jgi:small-conductance mechanosensitive channel